MSSDELDKKSADENTKENTSSGDENEEKDDVKEEKVNSKPAAKKKGADPPKIKQPAKKRVKTEQAEKESKKEEKKEKEKKVEEEEDEGDESAEENDVGNHTAVPLLDQPLEITGSRKRKEVQRFKPAAAEEEHKELKIPEGKGKALGDIERIDFNIKRAKPEDLKLLHRLCFGKPGKAATFKKSIKQFNGFEFEEASDDYEKKKATVEKSFKKVTIAHLKNICNIIDVEKSGTKDDILDRILSFLTCPVDSGKPLPGGKRARRTGASAKNYDEGEERFTSRKKTKGKKKDEDTGTEESENEKDESEEEEVKQNDNKKDDVQTTEESAPEEEEKEEKPKKGAKKGKKATDAADKKAPPKKRAAAKKVVEKKSDSEGGGDEDSEEEEPLAKKGKVPPTDEEIKTYVKSLLEGANLELITMKKVCQDVYAHYPDFDLGHKKEFIKTTVKSLISS